jgi:two-component system, OmpR family, sensor histidine kinase KdpD
MAVGDHTIERARGAWTLHADRLAQAAMQVWRLGSPVLLSLLLVAGTTLLLLGIDRVFGIAHVSIAYVLPVLIAATMLGLVPALVVAVAAVAVSAFFFYPPIYDFRVASPQQLIDLTMFVIVAVTTGQLAAAARANAARAKEREAEIRALYNFSRLLAVATEPADISAAVQNHLSAMTGRRVVYFAADRAAAPSERHQSGPSVPKAIRNAVDRLAGARTADGLTVADAETATRWLVRSVSPRSPEYGLLAIDMGDAGDDGEPSAMHARIDALLGDATASFERLGVAHAISEARLRAEAETLREALMGSVTHGLRTPLSSIIGSASILVETPAVATDQRSANLVGIVRDEAERLDHDIQRLVDATRISSAGVRPHLAWADPADIVNAALARQRRALAGHAVELRLSEDMPLVHVDPVLIEQALAQILDNAAKYSPPGTAISIDGARRGEHTAIAVGDEGAGLTAEEAAQVFERFYRGPRSAMTTTGTGLGLWIAHAFVSACAGRLEVASPGPGRGTTVTMLLPAPSIAKLSASGETYE